MPKKDIGSLVASVGTEHKLFLLGLQWVENLVCKKLNTTVAHFDRTLM